MKRRDTEHLSVLGWREWLALPALGIPQLKAKVDSGARSSALHTSSLETIGTDRVRFAVKPMQTSARLQWCEAELLDWRWVTDSGGHRELRPFISTEVVLGDESWAVEVSLTARDTMRFRMLLGRTALAGRFLVNPQASYLQGRRRA